MTASTERYTRTEVGWSLMARHEGTFAPFGARRYLWRAVLWSCRGMETDRVAGFDEAVRLGRAQSRIAALTLVAEKLTWLGRLGVIALFGSSPSRL